MFLLTLSLTGCGTSTDAVTLDDCDTSISDGVPTFFQDYFACVEADDDGGDVVLWTDGLPPHDSAYYETDHENYVAFDDQGGTHNQNPNTIGSQNFEITFPADPVAKGISIDASLVDNEMNTSDEEYGGGGQGITLNGVIAFAAMAAPGDDLSDEQYTFDLYEGHPAGDTYHYHFNTPGPLEVMVSGGYATTSTPGEAEIELYGVMCDGTVLLGCTELDGSTPDDSDFDAQNGHVHDIGSDFTDRYHTHVCPSLWPDYPYFPEIAYYEDGGC
ncbi:MAG: hypothetical protein ACI8RZ_000843 [Myxococcota bacterium]